MILKICIRVGLAMFCAACVNKIDTSGSLNSIGDEIKKLGYNEIRPPSTLHPPGTVVYVREAFPLTLQVVCEAAEVLGSAVGKVLGSPSVGSEWDKKAGVNFSAETSDIMQINARLGDEYVQRIGFELSDTTVGELSDTTLTSSMNVNSVAPICIDSVRDRIEAGFPLTMIQSTLGADVVYKVDFSNTVDASAKVAIFEQLAPVLRAEILDQASGILRGNSLIWGVRDDRFLFRKLVDYAGLKEDYSRTIASGEQASERLLSGVSVALRDVEPFDMPAGVLTARAVAGAADAAQAAARAADAAQVAAEAASEAAAMAMEARAERMLQQSMTR